MPLAPTPSLSSARLWNIIIDVSPPAGHPQCTRVASSFSRPTRVLVRRAPDDRTTARPPYTATVAATAAATAVFLSTIVVGVSSSSSPSPNIDVVYRVKSYTSFAAHLHPTPPSARASFRPFLVPILESIPLSLSSPHRRNTTHTHIRPTDRVISSPDL